MHLMDDQHDIYAPAQTNQQTNKQKTLLRQCVPCRHAVSYCCLGCLHCIALADGRTWKWWPTVHTYMKSIVSVRGGLQLNLLSLLYIHTRILCHIYHDIHTKQQRFSVLIFPRSSVGWWTVVEWRRRQCGMRFSLVSHNESELGM
jgi:hypothetical protein